MSCPGRGSCPVRPAQHSVECQTILQRRYSLALHEKSSDINSSSRMLGWSVCWPFDLKVLSTLRAFVHP